MHSILISLPGVSGSQVHPVEPLPAEQAQELFASHAFGLRLMPKAVCERAARVVKYCDGLPLTLEVLSVHPYSSAGHLAHCMLCYIRADRFLVSSLVLLTSYCRCGTLTHSTPADTGYFQVMGAHLPHPTLTWY